TRSVRGSSSRRKTVRGNKRYHQRNTIDTLAFEAEPVKTTLPDSIEVIEHGSSDSPVLGRLLNMPNPSRTDNASFNPTESPTRSRRFNIKMEASRVIEIQQALASRGFYRGEMTGVYDESTVDAMRRFQTDEKISVTGYPTAHALRKLELASW
ncbi:MAG: peptidoglycan-binding protein, partial [Acidobacteria bacterium]|nr:peptidoglycan-binding protein [Acidobacteriota bacterium]